MYLFVRSLPGLLTHLSTLTAHPCSEALQKNYIEPLQLIVTKFSLYEQLVEALFDMEALPEMRVKPSFHPDLSDLSEQLSSINKQVSNIYNAYHSKYPDLRLEKHSQYQHVFRTPKTDQEALFKSHKSLHIVSIQKNGIYLSCQELDSMNSEYVECIAEYDSCAAQVVGKALDTACTYLNLIESVGVLLAEIDVYASLATLAACSKGSYVRPVLHPMGTGVIKLQDARHPCVELMDHVNFIPNDYELIQGVSNFHIITGPNMGGKYQKRVYSAINMSLTINAFLGKSTYIRALGAIQVLAQIGSYLPCSRGEVTIVDGIYARVGAGDAQQKGVSTFFAEMLEASVILSTASRHSLLIIDELGRGTSTYDGYGLAYAISAYLVQHAACFVLFATHYQELVYLADDYPGVANQHVQASVQDGQVVMGYRLQPGGGGRSYGVQVAATAHFPRKVVQQAEDKLRQLERCIGTARHHRLHGR